MKKNYHLYLGRAGHLVVMSEFLIRGWNVAVPEVDIGDDIFVVQDNNGILRRVQVKTATSVVRQNGYSGQFNVPVNQLNNLRDFLIHYAFVVRHNEQWTKPIIIRQDYLANYLQNNKIGSEYDGYLNLYFSYSNDRVECSGLDFSKYIADFSDFPLLTK
jgi:hypothetical protein